MKYNIDYFIKKFTAIPEGKWCTGMYLNDNDQSCALGHCGVRYTESCGYNKTDEANALITIFGRSGKVININDFELELGNTPRTRILRALKEKKNEKTS